MSRTAIGTGRLSFDIAMFREDNGALAQVVTGHLESSTGMTQDFTHEMTERSLVEVQPKGKDGQDIAKYRVVGADAVEIARIGKNGVTDGPVKKFGGVDIFDNRPWYTKVVGDITIPNKDGSKHVAVTDAQLTACRSLTNAAWDSVVFSLLYDGVASETASKATQDRVIGSALIADYRKTLEASAAMVKDDATFKMWSMFSGYAGDATSTADAINELCDLKAQTLREEWEAKKAASDKANAEKEAKNAAENAKLVPTVAS